MTKVAKESRVDPTIEQHAARLKLPAWQAAALKARQQWPIGKRVTQADYKKALDDMLSGHTDGSIKPKEDKGGDA